jgi:hypothetical protein
MASEPASWARWVMNPIPQDDDAQNQADEAELVVIAAHDGLPSFACRGRVACGAWRGRLVEGRCCGGGGWLVPRRRGWPGWSVGHYRSRAIGPVGLAACAGDNAADRRAGIDVGLQLPKRQEAANQAEQHRGLLGEVVWAVIRTDDVASPWTAVKLSRVAVPAAIVHRRGGPIRCQRSGRPWTLRITAVPPGSPSTVARVAAVSCPPRTSTRPELAIRAREPVSSPAAMATDRRPDAKRSHPMTCSSRRSAYSRRRADRWVSQSTSPRRTWLSPGCAFTAPPSGQSHRWRALRVRVGCWPPSGADGRQDRTRRLARSTSGGGRSCRSAPGPISPAVGCGGLRPWAEPASVVGPMRQPRCAGYSQPQ